MAGDAQVGEDEGGKGEQTRVTVRRIAPSSREADELLAEAQRNCVIGLGIGAIE